MSTEKNIYIEEHNHTDAIIRVGRYSQEQKEYLKRNIPFIDEEYFSNKLYNPKSLFWSLNSLLKGARSLYYQRLALIWKFSDYKNIITKFHLA